MPGDAEAQKVTGLVGGRLEVRVHASNVLFYSKKLAPWLSCREHLIGSCLNSQPHAFPVVCQQCLFQGFPTKLSDWASVCRDFLAKSSNSKVTGRGERR